MLSISKAFHLYCYLMQVDRPELEFNKNIIQIITNEFLDVERHGIRNLEAIKQFTAILLLKFKYQVFVIYHIIMPVNLLNNPNQDQVENKALTVKVYYSLRDHMMLIPQDCEKSIYYKVCVFDQLNHNIQLVSTKYGLKK